MIPQYPGNGIFIVQGEITLLMISMKKFHSSSRSCEENENNPLLKNLSELKNLLDQISDLREIEPITFLDPFLDVIRSVETSFQVTTLALTSINKFISLSLITSVNEKYLLPVINTLADVVAHAVHAHFFTTDDPSDAMILKKIVEVLRSLVLSSLGFLLSNDSICEIMLSCFKICFETRLNDLLRHSAETCLRDIVQFLFTRLPLFVQSPTDLDLGQNKKMRMRPRSKELDSKKKRKQSPPKINSSRKSSVALEEHNENDVQESAKNSTSAVENKFPSSDSAISQIFTSVVHSTNDDENQRPGSKSEDDNPCYSNQEVLVVDSLEKVDVDDETVDASEESTLADSADVEIKENVANPSSSAVQLETSVSSEDWLIAERIPLEPHNSICVQELLSFFALICNPYDTQNTDVMRHISLSLWTVALEIGAEAICCHPSVLSVIKDTLCRNLLSILNTECVPMQIFTACLHVFFLLFESMRNHLKFQMENFLSRLLEIIRSQNSKISFSKKELALETLVRLWRIPGFITEVYMNYDCGQYSPNLFEETTILLSKYANPTDVIHNTHLLALNALLITVESIEKYCQDHVAEDSVVSDPQTVETDTSANVLTSEQLITLKRKKKLLWSGTQHFNADPKKGIQFLQEQHLLSNPLDAAEVGKFLRENPQLDKQMLGDYLSNRANIKILEEYVQTFDFVGMRIDQALRIFFQAFRLPSESGLILQLFADHWHDCNNEKTMSKDSVCKIAYSTVALNTMLHNKNALKNHLPMTLEIFKKSLRGENEGKDFDENFLEMLFQSVKNEEMIVPSEHVGLVRENYLWELLLTRGSGKDGSYLRAKGGHCDHELFLICWDPVVSALRFIFDKARDLSICYKALQGFRKCAAISAHYGMSNELDTLIWSLCGFTSLMNYSENPESCTVSFGMNAKARIAARTVFSVVHRHGDILKDGWRPVFDCIFQLFRCKLLPKILVEAEDFLELSGKISLIRKEVHKTSESGLLSSLYSYITLSRDAASQRITSEEETEYIEIAKTCVAECHLENLIQESKFLRLESLHELLKMLIRTFHNEEGVIVVGTKQEEDKAVFFLELMIKVVIQNRDRISSVWHLVCNHLQGLLVAATAAERQFLMERCVIGILRLAIRLVRRDEISSSVLQSLQMLLMLERKCLYSVSRQISYGLYELLKTGAANIHSKADWSIIFLLFEVIGAGAPLPKLSCNSEYVAAAANSGNFDDLNIEKTSESHNKLAHEKKHLSQSEPNLRKTASPRFLPSCNCYLFHNDTEYVSKFYTVADLLPHDPFSLVKCCESLVFLVQDVAHITPFNFEECVHTMRTFVEAILFSGERRNRATVDVASKTRFKNKVAAPKPKNMNANSENNPYSSDESDTDEYPDSYFQAPLLLLELFDTLHTKTAHIHKGLTKLNLDQESQSLWPYWCPLLQGIARLCCDPRKLVRMRAITYLQRALLMHDLQMLKANEWESCFNHVLFPLLGHLAEPFEGNDSAGVEETRMRAVTLLSKVFLQHLLLLQLLTSFTNLWLKILEFMNRYMSIDENNDLLNEAIQEYVKNMVLVVESAKLFPNDDEQSQFWELTWAKIDKFVPNLQNELSRSHSTMRETNESVASVTSPELPNNFAKDTEVTPQLVTSRENKELKYTEASLIQHSVPLFPHMGQLISTPIGPPGYQHAEAVADCRLERTQISSLVASTPEFLPSLSSFRAQSPPTIYRNVDHGSSPMSSSPPDAFTPTTSNLPNLVAFPSNTVSLPPNITAFTSNVAAAPFNNAAIAPPSNVNISNVSLPLPQMVPTRSCIGDVALSRKYATSSATSMPLSSSTLPVSVFCASSQPVNINMASAMLPTPGTVQRSSSICEASVIGDHRQLVESETSRTELAPALTQSGLTSFCEPSTSPNSKGSLLPEQLQQQQVANIFQPSYHFSVFPQPSYVSLPSSSPSDAYILPHQVDGS